MQPPASSTTNLTCREQPIVIDLPGRFAAAAIHRERGDRGDAVPTRAQGFEGFGKAETEWTDHSGGDNRDASSFYFLTAKCHSVQNITSLPIPVDL